MLALDQPAIGGEEAAPGGIRGGRSRIQHTRAERSGQRVRKTAHHQPETAGKASWERHEWRPPLGPLSRGLLARIVPAVLRLARLTLLPDGGTTEAARIKLRADSGLYRSRSRNSGSFGIEEPAAGRHTSQLGDRSENSLMDHAARAGQKRKRSRSNGGFAGKLLAGCGGEICCGRRSVGPSMSGSLG